MAKTKAFIVWLPAFGVTMFLGSAAASAAAPAYCALYRREYAADTVQPNAAAGMLQSVQDQAYYRCLNQDEDPPLPMESAYFAGKAAVTQQDGLTKHNTSSVPDAVAPSLPRVAPPVPTRITVATASNSAVSAGYRPSGLTAWTPEWQAWCQRNFPNSWDAKTGTILHVGADTREVCQ